MDYEKKYKEALEKARQFSEKPYLEDSKGIVEYIFPELKESEDERIRKEMIFYFQEEIPQCSIQEHADKMKKFIAWLEKQGKFKSSEWKEGDVVKYGSILALVINGRKAMKSNGEIFTIQYPEEWVKALSYETEQFFNEVEKQRESDKVKAKKFLINKGYPIDANGIFPTYEEIYNIIKEGLEKQGEQMPADKIQLGKKYKCIASPRYSTFVKGLIYRPEDKFLCSLMNFCSDCFEPIEEDEQKPADTEKGAKGNEREIPFTEQKPAWSEEDESMLYGVMETEQYMLDVVNGIEKFDVGNASIKEDCTKELAWLKILKDRYTWKPSDEQMNALNYVVNLMASSERPTENDLYYNILKSLREQLRKLKG